MPKVDHFFDERFSIDFLGKVPQLGLTSSKIASCEIIPLKVKDDKTRGVLLFKLSVRGGESRPTSPVSLVGKIRRSTKDKQTFEVMRQLWEKGFGQGSRLRISQPIAYVDDYHLLLSYRGNGLSLEQLLEAGHKSAASCVAQAGQWLAQFHRTAVASPKKRSVEDETEHMAKRFERTVKKFEKKHKSLIPRARWVMDEIVQRARAVDPSLFVLTHGDFLPKNVLFDGSDLTVIDLGRIAHFDAAKDIGKFIGHVVVKAHMYPGLEPEALRESFLKNYAGEYSKEFWERVVAHEARSYVRRSAREDDPEAALYWLGRAEECLKGPERASSSGL